MPKSKPLKLIIDTNLWVSFIISNKRNLLDPFLFNEEVRLLFSAELIKEIQETIEDETILIDDISTAALEITDTKDIILDEEIKTEPIVEVEETIVPIIPIPDKPLSIAEQIMLEIQQLKEERARKATETNEVVQPVQETAEDTLTVIEEIVPEIETTEKPLSIQDEIIAKIQKIKEERERKLHEVIETPVPEITENTEQEVEKIDTTIPDETIVEDIKEAITEDTKEEIVEMSSAEVEKENIVSETTEKPLSIQDEIIARIQKIKEDREHKLHEVIQTPAPEIIEKIEQEVEKIDTTIPDQTIVEDIKEAITEDTKEEIVEMSSAEVEKENIISETTEKPLSIQDEIIARIQKIKEERAKQSAAENNIPSVIEEIKKEIPKQETVEIIENKEVETNIKTIDEPVIITEKEEKENDIKIVDKTERFIIPIDIDAEKNIPEKLLSVSEHEKDIELIESKLQPEIEKEIAELEKTNDQFEKIFPDPLLVQVDVTELKKESTYQEKPIPQENIKEEIAEHTSLISNKSDLFIPNVEEDVIEEVSSRESKAVSEETATEEMAVTTLDEAAIREPHTFVEWLKLLDGSLQIQTTESPKETDNWIEIPRYEVEQALANKEEIRKEEQKLFEPNFEEGEVDLFNEIDEEVSKVASESVSFKQDMMTETLAKIYQKQGKTEKALEIYNTLLLKFPKKSAYFATLIKKIEKER